MKRIAAGLVLFFCVFLALLPDAGAYAKKKDFRKAFKKWTRGDEQYQREDFYASISWNATYLSPEFREAVVNEVARTYEQSPSQSDAYRREQNAKFGNYTVFFVGFYAYDFKHADLSQKNPQWKITMEVDGRRYDPVKVEFVKKPTPLDAQLFHYVKPWARHYYVYFPGFASLRPGDIKLHVNGPYSRGTLVW